MNSFAANKKDQPDLLQISRKVFDETAAATGLESSKFRQPVRDAFGDMNRAHIDAIAAARQLPKDNLEITEKAHLIPDEGVRRLRAEAKAEAEATIEEARRRGDAARKKLEAELSVAVVAPINQQREALARQELEMIFRDASPQQIRERALEIAQTGSRDAVSVLLSSYGSSLLATKGIDGREKAELVTAARGVLVASVPNRSDSTDEEIAAANALQQLDRFGAAFGAIPSTDMLDNMSR